MKLKFTIIIPIYNEVESIFILLDETLEEFKNDDKEIIIVNDGSTDEFISQFYSREYSKSIKLINHNNKMGKCFAMLTGIKHAKNRLIGIMDGDGQNPPSEVRKIIEAWSNFKNKSFLLVCGHRIKRKDTIMKKISSNIANKFRRHLLDDDCYDTACALKAFNKNDYLKIDYFKNIHRFLPALFKMNGGSVKNIPVIDRPRIFGKSKFNFNNRFWVGIIDLIKVKLLINKNRR